MIRLTVEEMNLLSIYHEGSKAQLMENMTAALPFMDEAMRPFAAVSYTHLDVYKRQAEKAAFKANVNFQYHKTLHDNPQLTSNPLSRFMQKQLSLIHISMSSVMSLSAW